jgi:acetylornithine/succinyldiaminopimelate/putrescine aminotransferase
MEAAIARKRKRSANSRVREVYVLKEEFHGKTISVMQY